MGEGQLRGSLVEPLIMKGQTMETAAQESALNETMYTPCVGIGVIAERHPSPG